MRDRHKPVHSLAGLAFVMASLACLWGAPATAQDVTPQQRAALAAMLDRFATATREGDGAVVAATLPPGVVAVIAAERGVDSQAERRAIEEQITAIKQAGLRKTVTFDLDHAAFGSLKDGAPYAVVPMHDMADGAKRLDLHVQALALTDADTWYLLTLGTPERLEWLGKAYPEFDGVALPTSSTGARP